MSATSEETPSSNPLDNLIATPRRAPERPEPRLATIGTPFPRASKLDAPRPLVASPGDRLETAMSEFVRRQIKPEAVPEPADLGREGKRRLLTASAIGVGAIGIASLAAFLFVSFFPKEKDAIQSFAAAVPAATSQLRPGGEAAAAPASRRLLAENDRGESLSHEQSERLLQQFVQWRQKLALTDKP